MHWIHLTDEDQLQKIIVRSQEKPQVIFKYSTECHLSEVAFQRLQKYCCPEHIDFHFLDLTIYHNISIKLCERFRLAHQSPQILVVKDGECIFQSNCEISLEEIIEHSAVIAS